MAPSEPGTLYVVATPIGNLQDMSVRGAEILRGVAAIACEDTRHSAVLLQHLGISTKTVALHDFNEDRAAAALLARLVAGENIALISDAGTPLVSDPGFRLVRGAHERGIPVRAVPGASAVIAALSVSGLPTDRFSFEGFPPPKTSARRRLFESLAADPRTLIFYESAHRIHDCLMDMTQVFGTGRPATLARELTKRFEAVHCATLGELRAWLDADRDRLRGEFVVLVGGATEDDLRAQRQEQGRALLDALRPYMSTAQAVALAHRTTHADRNDLYQYALEHPQAD
ncbi:MAG TPA: 16S rRNA (cytidine(1402)-2'-O)-methyltransferase [Acidiferrobacteraceae bacterium]|nr:16S rRNA (cytidine(1402)-2'-O)-methyltransferase [Acidiferrobacteraceae bacterium]